MLRFSGSSVVAALLIAVVFGAFFFCEYLIYFPTILKCAWPKLSHARGGPAVRAMVLSDTHLLGAVGGHWFDKLRREWQMERAFQTALWLLKPEIVFILGDIFDEGKWSSQKHWEDDVRRFHRMFRHSTDTELVVLVGNHDIGFHYEMDWFKLQRFEKVFNASSTRIVTKKGVNFRPFVRSRCVKRTDVTTPACCFVPQHYPLYRVSDASCTGQDAAPPEERHLLFREKYDVLSKEASQRLLQWFKPRLVLSGHTHSGCEVLHDKRYPEVSVPSFSWRNRNNPSFILASVSPGGYSLSKCFLPEESTVIGVYCSAGACLLLLLLAHCLWMKGLLQLSLCLLGKHKSL
uniref:Metallophosphoesterase 1 n=1 Tax=Fundulus heteroclitus TaxID=8078 RepID=A0A3Q2NXB5_FUNHE